jgi:glycosyltransferase involved in cell wall biosynthesis
MNGKLVRVLLVSRRFPPDLWSGSETVFENLYKQACQHHDVRLVAGYVNGRDQIPPEAIGVNLSALSWGQRHAAIWTAARSERWRFNPDAVLSNSMEAPSFGGKTVTIVHDLNFGSANRRWHTPAREWWYRRKSSRLRAIVTPSAATRAALCGIGCEEQKIQVISNGVDLERFKPLARRPRKGERWLLCPGRIMPGKGQHLAIDAVRRLAPELKEKLKLFVVGTVVDPLYLHHLKLAAKGQPVVFETDVDEMAPHYQQADLVLFPTLLTEGFGYAAIEAMACGRPVIWSDQQAVREATGGIGVPILPSAEALMAEITRYLSSPRKYTKMGSKGRAFVEERYGWSQVWGEYEAVLGLK